ncbi:hypothetical protein LCGC14_2572320 [marine sediment metagenome]|uniref:Uncharacterized protein n=1 Tax=marine sediment metagenome TaxID=412755 RepID=A0A0F9AGX3_9ZZZZ
MIVAIYLPGEWPPRYFKGWANRATSYYSPGTLPACTVITLDIDEAKDLTEAMAERVASKLRRIGLDASVL